MKEPPYIKVEIATRPIYDMEEEESYKLLIDSIKDYAIFMLDPKGFIVTWNPGAEKLKGYKKEEILKKHFSTFYTADAIERKHPDFELKTAIKTGRFEEEGWRVKKDGSMFWANVVISAMFDKNKKLQGFAKITRDLTERKNLEDKLTKTNEELIESEEKARLLIEGVKDYAIFLLTADGTIATWNEGAKNIHGYESTEIIGESFLKFFAKEVVDAQYPQFELSKALEDGRYEDEGWRVRKDGTKFWANALITPIYNSRKQHIGFTKIVRDLSERIKNNELMKKNLALHQVNIDLDNFIYTASHDLKSPISNLEGLITLLERNTATILGEKERNIVEMMSKSIHKLYNTISDLTEVTKAQKNLEDKMEVINFKEMLDDVKEQLQPEIENAKVNLVEKIKVKHVSFARAGLRSVIYNLLSNAIKYRSLQRPAEISVSTFLENGQEIISIKDNGLGLSEMQREKLFGMFKRFHNHIEGSGIGLYIVKRTMENYGGKVVVKSTENKGTEFKLYFDS